jgi:hypothetical protein
MKIAASIIRAMSALMMEAASTSETSVNFYQTTRRLNPEDSPLHAPRRDNLKSYLWECELNKRHVKPSVRLSATVLAARFTQAADGT